MDSFSPMKFVLFVAAGTADVLAIRSDASPQFSVNGAFQMFGGCVDVLRDPQNARNKLRDGVAHAVNNHGFSFLKDVVAGKEGCITKSYQNQPPQQVTIHVHIIAILQ